MNHVSKRGRCRLLNAALHKEEEDANVSNKRLDVTSVVNLDLGVMIVLARDLVAYYTTLNIKVESL